MWFADQKRLPCRMAISLSQKNPKIKISWIIHLNRIFHQKTIHLRVPHLNGTRFVQKRRRLWSRSARGPRGLLGQDFTGDFIGGFMYKWEYVYIYIYIFIHILWMDYNWWFHWDYHELYINYKWGDVLVLITGISGQYCRTCCNFRIPTVLCDS